MISPARLRFRIAICALFLLFFQVKSFLAALPASRSGAADLRSLYTAGYMVRTGHASDIYRFSNEEVLQDQLAGTTARTLPFIYPPFATLPFIPLSALPFRTASLVLFAINLLLAIAASFVLRPHLPALKALSPILPPLIVLCFYPVVIALLQGQVSMILLILLSASFASLKCSRPFIAGLFLAGVLIKCNIALPIVLLFAIWRMGRVVAGFLTGAAALALLSFAVAGSSGVTAYIRSLFTAASSGALGASTQQPYQVFSGKMPNLHGLFFTLSGGAPWGTALVVAASIAVLVWTALQPPSFPRAIVAALLVSYHLHLHDLSLLLIPICLIFEQTLARSSTSKPLSPRTKFVFIAAIVWMASPLHAIVMGLDLNGLFALSMLPFLLPTQAAEPVAPRLAVSVQH